MSQPAVTLTELDGAIGVLPAGAKILAVLGPADSGPIATPAAFAKSKNLVSNFGGGPTVEAAAHFIDKYKRPVLFVRTTATVDGSYTALVDDVAGTSVVTIDALTTPNDDYDVYVEVITGGTIGVAGITLKWSLDEGRTLSATTALGTATSFVIPGSGGIEIEFAAGTLIAGDNVSFRAIAPCWNDTDLGVAMDALGLSTTQWEIVAVVGPQSATSVALLDTKISGLAADGKDRAWIGHTRMPNLSETEAAYKTSLDGVFVDSVSTYGMLCSGADKMPSAVSGRSYRRPTSHAIAALQASVSEEVNIAAIDIGRLNVLIRDSNGNIDEHDESANPGLDDSRFCVLRTHADEPGVFVNRPRLFSADGSDFQLMPHRRVMNLYKTALRAYFIRRLNKPVFVDAVTGFILEEEALEIEAGANAVANAILKGKASSQTFTLSRTDNLLSTKTMTGQGRIVSLAYPENINIDVGFSNPANNVQAV